MDLILKIINWIGILCGFYLMFMIIKIGKHIIENEIKKFLKK